MKVRIGYVHTQHLHMSKLWTMPNLMFAQRALDSLPETYPAWLLTLQVNNLVFLLLALSSVPWFPVSATYTTCTRTQMHVLFWQTPLSLAYIHYPLVYILVLLFSTHNCQNNILRHMSSLLCWRKHWLQVHCLCHSSVFCDRHLCSLTTPQRRSASFNLST